MSWTARKAGAETSGGDSRPPAAMVNVAGTRAWVLPPEPDVPPPPELEPLGSPAPPVGFEVLFVVDAGVVLFVVVGPGVVAVVV